MAVESFGDIHALPDDCIANVLSLTSPKDACRLSAVAATFRSASQSDTVWDRFLPSDYRDLISRAVDGSDSDSLLAKSNSKKDLYLHLCEHPILIDGGRKSFSLEKWSGKKCYMLAARALVIEWDSPQSWKWITLPESRFSEVAELLNVCWFEIRGKIKSEMLSPGTNYAAYLVYTWKFTAYGFEEQGAKAYFVHKSEKRSVSLYTDGAERQRIEFVPRGLSELFSHRTDRIQQEATMETNSEYPKQRSDGWMEVKLGEYFVKEDGGDLEVCLVEVNDGNWKSGLIIQGIEIRPETVNN